MIRWLKELLLRDVRTIAPKSRMRKADDRVAEAIIALTDALKQKKGEKNDRGT